MNMNHTYYFSVMKILATALLFVTLGLGFISTSFANPSPPPMKIQKVEFGNLDANGNVINGFGSTLYASDIRFLAPNLYYEGLGKYAQPVTIRGKLFHPSGQLMTTSNAPSDYSFEFSFRVQPGKGRSNRLAAWGSATESIFTPGVYGFEIWYEGSMLYKTSITLLERSNGLVQGDWRTALRKCGDNVTVDCNNGYYKGALEGRKRSGMGVYAWKSGSYYFGDWVSGDCTGYGMKISQANHYVPNCPNCVYYVGNWSGDKKVGYGYCYDRQGNLLYQGDFANDKPTQTYPMRTDGSRKFEYQKFVSGNSYLGETVDGMPSGYGIFIWNNGDVWFGNYAYGERNGKGIMLYHSGNITSGTWRNDKKM